MKYRYHWSFKLLALLLAVVSGAALILGAVGLVLGELGYYEQSHNGYLYIEEKDMYQAILQSCHSYLKQYLPLLY